MSAVTRILASIASFLAAALLPVSGHAQQKLIEVDGMPFSLCVASKMQAKLLPFEAPEAYSAASVLPANIVQLDVIEVTWPRSKRVLKLGVAEIGSQRTPATQRFSVLSAGVGDDKPRLVELEDNPIAGKVSRVCIWPTAGSDGELVVILTSTSNSSDSLVCAFKVATTGLVTTVDTSGARSAYGGFEVEDLDGDGLYELITLRNLDGMPGGFSYRAVRSYNGSSYAPNPQGYKQTLFKAELAFFDWVVQTAEDIKLDPDPYLNRNHYGFFYVAEYQGILYGFDSLIEPANRAADAVRSNAHFPKQREALQRVVTYRNELRSWIAGGTPPAAWKLSE
jgi:hypothetical protein